MAKIFISFNVTSPDDIILTIREVLDLTADASPPLFYAAPHTQRNVTIIDLNPVMHRIQIWSTPDGVTLENLKGSCDIDASITEVTAFDLIYFIVDGLITGTPNYDPPSNQNEYANPELIGKTYVVYKSGFGPLIWGRHIVELAGGGFEYVDGQEFSTGEEFSLMVSNSVQAHITDTGKGYPGDTVDVTGNLTFSAAHYGKLLEVNAAANITITITNINTLPNSTVFGINTHNGTQKFVTLQLPVGAYCIVQGEQRNAVYIGRGETVQFIKKGAYLRIVSWDGDYKRVGERVKKDGLPPLNSLPEIGGWYLISEYPRPYYWYVDELPAGDFFTDLSEATPLSVGAGFWGKGTDKFWVPDRRDLFDINTDGTRRSGNFEAEDVMPHFHAVGTQNINTTPAYNRAPVHPVRSWSTTPQQDANQLASTDLNTGIKNRPDNMATNSYRIT